MAEGSTFLVVCEVGFGTYTVDRFPAEREARAAAAKLWCCWVLFRSSGGGTELAELAVGGVGFAHPAIRKHAETNLRARARDQDARAQAAVAAEARAAKLAAAQSKPRGGAAQQARASDGRPDVSNPTAWD